MLATARFSVRPAAACALAVEFASATARTVRPDREYLMVAKHPLADGLRETAGQRVLREPLFKPARLGDDPAQDLPTRGSNGRDVTAVSAKAVHAEANLD